MNLTNVFIDILRSAMTQTSCDMIEGLSTRLGENPHDISQKTATGTDDLSADFSNESFQKIVIRVSAVLEGRYDRSGGKSGKKSILFLMLFDKMRQNGLTPLIVKGIVCRDLYPNPDLRTSNDEDLYIPRDQFGKMDEFLQAEGFMREELIKDKVYQEVPYQNPRNGLYFELHMDLFPRNPERMGILINYLKMHLIPVWKQIFKGVKVLTLNPKQHFISCMPQSGTFSS